MQDKPLRLDPFTGERLANIITAAQAREQQPSAAWLFDPWSGRRRSAGDVFTDPKGELIVPVEVPAVAVGIGSESMSMFATQEDYWRHLAESIAAELFRVALALGVGRVADIARQIARIRSADDMQEATRLIDSMWAGDELVSGGISLPSSEQIDRQARAVEIDAVHRALTQKLGQEPADPMGMVEMIRVPETSLVEVRHEGEPLIYLQPPRLTIPSGDGEKPAGMMLSMVLEFGRPAEEPAHE